MIEPYTVTSSYKVTSSMQYNFKQYVLIHDYERKASAAMFQHKQRLNE